MENLKRNKPVFTSSQSRLTWLKERWEILVPLLGALLMPGFLQMASESEQPLSSVQLGVLWGMALVYAGLVIWSPMALPSKEPRPVTWQSIRRAALTVTLIVIFFLVLRGILGPSTPSSNEAKGGLIVLLLAVLFGIAGVVAEGTLPLDLFPLLRQRSLRRGIYVLVAPLFLVVLVQVLNGVFSGVAHAIGSALGETPPVSGDAATAFDATNPPLLLLGQIFSAGIEELFFRVGIMTLVWAYTRRWGWGVLVSAALFGLYHIWPANPMSAYNLAAPLTMVLSHFGAGLVNGLIYRYRGFSTALMVHGLGNWLLILLLS